MLKIYSASVEQIMVLMNSLAFENINMDDESCATILSSIFDIESLGYIVIRCCFFFMLKFFIIFHDIHSRSSVII